jgi:hypothetical protein
MADSSKQDPECGMCGSIKGLSFVFITEQPLESNEAYVPNEPRVVCRNHWQELIDSDEYYVRTIAPVPSERGGFSRTAEREGEILYDHDVGESCWIKFSPESEIDLEDGERPEGESE